ncbi:hypothetical protein MMC17_006755 [Xylographa soralifera]|nr:hypothetical protein [Xylographa soralifera]
MTAFSYPLLLPAVPSPFRRSSSAPSPTAPPAQQHDAAAAAAASPADGYDSPPFGAGSRLRNPRDSRCASHAGALWEDMLEVRVRGDGEGDAENADDKGGDGG